MRGSLVGTWGAPGTCCLISLSPHAKPEVGTMQLFSFAEEQRPSKVKSLAREHAARQ